VLTLILLLGVVAAILYTSLSAPTSLWVRERLSIFTVVFLGIFIEVAPFLLMGIISSGVVEVFVSDDWLARVIPFRALPTALTGSFLGLRFSFRNCGTVPLAALNIVTTLFTLFSIP
jgi:uncharacterized membrane protein YraQ (UPF0718 family)